MTARTKKQAWEMADEIFPTDYNKDGIRSERAGYDVYCSPVNELNYICDLGNRLEINLSNSNGTKTINIWIEDYTDSEKAEMRKYIDDFLYHMEDNFGVRTSLLKNYGLDEVLEKLNKIWKDLGGEVT